MFATGSDLTLLVVLVVFVIAFTKLALGGKTQLRIDVKDGCVTELRGVAKAKVRDVTDFLERAVTSNGKVKVLGRRDPQGVLRLSFRGKIDEGARQQIRNYLKMTL
jgi:hypothetical protein